MKICLLISLQYAKGIPPGFRENLDQAWIYQLHSKPQMEGAVENFLGHYDKKTALNVLDTSVWRDMETEQRQILVVDDSGQFARDRQLFAALPMDPGKFVLGCREYWGDKEPPAEPIAELWEHPDWEDRKVK